MGRGIPTDQKRARHWYRTAALQGYSRGQLHFGRVLEEGVGGPQDLSGALEWYQKASVKGNASATERLQSLQRRMADSGKGAGTKLSTDPRRILVPAEEVSRINALAHYELQRLQNATTQASNVSKDSFAAIMQMECSDYNVNYLDREILAVQATTEEHDPGLKFESGYRFRDGDVDDDHQSAYAGLSWDLLNEGLLENKSQARRLSLQREIEEIRAEQNRHEALFKCRDTFLFSSFNGIKQTLLQRKKEVVADLF